MPHFGSHPTGPGPKSEPVLTNNMGPGEVDEWVNYLRLWVPGDEEDEAYALQSCGATPDIEDGRPSSRAGQESIGGMVMVVAYYMPHNDGTETGILDSPGQSTGLTLVDLYEVDGEIRTFDTRSEAEAWLTGKLWRQDKE